MLDPARVYHSPSEPIKEPVRSVLKSYPAVHWYYSENSYLRTSGGIRSKRLGVPVGPKAQRLTESNTAILYRDRNCLGI
jgi:hypothetical protein